MTKLRIEHCGVKLALTPINDRVEAAHCFVCGSPVQITYDPDLDRWEYLSESLDDCPIQLLKVWIQEYFITNRRDSFAEFYARKMSDTEDD